MSTAPADLPDRFRRLDGYLAIAESRRRLYSLLTQMNEFVGQTVFATVEYGREVMPKMLLAEVVGSGGDQGKIDKAFELMVAIHKWVGNARSLLGLDLPNVESLPLTRDAEECARLAHLSALPHDAVEPVSGVGTSAAETYLPPPGDEESPVNWLEATCGRLERVGVDGAAVMPAQHLYEAVVKILCSTKTDDEIQMELFDLIGIEGFDDISQIIERRQAIRSASRAGCQVTGGSLAAVPHSSVTVTSRGSKQQFRRKRQEQRKMMRGTRPDVNAKLTAAESEVSPLDALRRADFGIGNQRVTLPTGTTRETFEGWEQISIPAVMPPDKSTFESTLISIAQLDVWARPAFREVTLFNRMQSRCFEPAYRSNENLLICAPTGAGKTNVALLCVLHEIKQHVPADIKGAVIPGSVSADMFKVVYVAPMKALAQEIVAKFSRALSFLKILVRELTGDMQLSKKEIEETHIIVTTPEKWDVITRKSNDFISLVRLLIFDEVHILHDTRGSVIEILVARTIRQVESSQSMIRIVGLSATLPNYADVAAFLRVNPQTGLLVFDPSYRPVPLSQTYIGISHPNAARRALLLNSICYDKLVAALESGFQVMIFVHSRKDTAATAEAMIERATENETLHLLESSTQGAARAKFAKCGSPELRKVASFGIGIHHAGMLREDRRLVESHFESGVLRVICTTATLAWGVNLPAHTVIIKGTQIYDAQQGGYVDLSMLDVMQIFGRAGRPQYDTSGEGIIITTHDKLAHYLRLLTHQMPIESRLIETLADNLNAEINLGTVANVQEALRWIRYTYLYIRMLRNPMHYGVEYAEIQHDPTLAGRCRMLIDDAVARLVECRMLKVPVGSDLFFPTDLGRTASFFYVSHWSIELYNKRLSATTVDDDVILNVIADSREFAQLKLRNEEIPDLEDLRQQSCPVEVTHLLDTRDKVNILLQAYISRHRVTMPSLSSDTNYVIQSAGRICRALFEIALKRGWSHLSLRLLAFCKMIDKRMWDFETPLRQFPSAINMELAHQIEERGLTFSRIIELGTAELGELLPSRGQGSVVKKMARCVPRLFIEWRIQPINHTVCRVHLDLRPDFHWAERFHGYVQIFRLLAFESDSFEGVHHAEEIIFHRADFENGLYEVDFYVSVADGAALPENLFVSVDSDIWIGSETAERISFDGVVLPDPSPPHTTLLDLHPLPVTALNNRQFEKLYSFGQFNTVQTQCFHVMYHMDSNVLLGAPTGSGKTIVAELAILKLFRDQPDQTVIYIAPLKALARERLIGWRLSLGRILGVKIVEITGDVSPTSAELRGARILVTTPEKMDSMSRKWRTRSYLRQCGLVIIDEIHLLGADRGPVLEVIVSRLRSMSASTSSPIRIVGLSTSLANPDDVVDWLNIDPRAVYNFHPVVRPTSLSVHIAGYPGSRHYCPRMQMLNKPTYASIMAYSHDKPAIVFVSSRRQTRLTALGIISLAIADGHPYKFLHISTADLQQVLTSVSDVNLRQTLEFGIGLHHAGLQDHDRRLVESMFSAGQIQVLVCTSTLAWGVNLPAHLCVIKGTEYYDAAKNKYVDYPITDIIQMMGRAGRPQYKDSEAHACVLVHQPKKAFYMKFLYSPFPVESSLAGALHDHINAEVQGGTLRSVSDCVDYLSWTFLFRRLTKNPTYYGLKDSSPEGIRSFLLKTITQALCDLRDAGCIQFDEQEGKVGPLELGGIASFYYLKFKTVGVWRRDMTANMNIVDVCDLLASACEFDELPVRHSEDDTNARLAKSCRWQSIRTPDPQSPHFKAFVLIQAHLQRLPLPVVDYVTDTKTVLDQAKRVLQAMLTLATSEYMAETALSIISLMQCIHQARTEDANDCSVLPLPSSTLNWLTRRNVKLRDILEMAHSNTLTKMLKGHNNVDVAAVEKCVATLPYARFTYEVAPDLASLSVTTTVSCGRSNTLNESTSWYIVVTRLGRICAFGRIPARRESTVTLPLRNIAADSSSSEAPVDPMIHLVSDTYLGLDVTVEMHLPRPSNGS
ncbi:Sec63 Brl domain [Plasmodiophora brassicae]|uniref:Uncharacterized protein n=1 Tax=Plasmodiophora brassicae TaxID=37360 RepID=A0A3P3Y9E2_PLABS|nr:unnamed protein product [Plasmodiophora brassicae]